MVLLRSLALWLLLGCLEQHVFVSSAARGTAKVSRRAQRNGGKSPVTARGKFPTSDGLQCLWNGRQDGETATLWVTCNALRKGSVANVACEYNAKPQSCPGYQSDTKGFWKQVGRALKKNGSTVCRSELALVKTGMCKRAPSAHFKLNANTTMIINSRGPTDTPPPPPQFSTTSVGTTLCTKRADHRETAEEYCSSFASLCVFFLSMLQRDDC